MAKQFDRFSSIEVCEYVKTQASALETYVFQKMVEHKIDGETFLVLNEEYLREIAPLLGDRLKIKRIISSLLATCEESASQLSVPLNDQPGRSSTPISCISSPTASSGSSKLVCKSKNG